MPVDLGGARQRCEVYPPPVAPPPEPELVDALIQSYRADLAPGEALELAFFHGGVPSDALLEVAAGLPVRVCCSPADLSPEEADRLAARGVGLVELDVLTFADPVLRALSRGYNAARVQAQRAGLARRGVAVGLTLMPGLPGSSHPGALADVDRALDPNLPRPALIRVLPALALAGAGLARWMEEGRWRPMRLGEAVTTVAAMLDRLEPSGVPVARVGWQPQQDLPWRMVGGPWHPNLRGLVAGRRLRRRAAEALRGVEPGASVTLGVNPKDEGDLRGSSGEHLRALRVALSLEDIRLAPDARQDRGTVVLVEARSSA